MDLASRRRCEADKNYDAVAARILTGGVDIEIWFPIVDGPNISGLIDNDGGLTHHWYETGWSRWLTVPVQGDAVMK